MKDFNVIGKNLRHWWFGVLLAVVLVATAVAATPYGHSAIDTAASNASGYYAYLSIVFKS